MADRFEMLLDKGFESNFESQVFKQAVIEVADTAYICQAWFESNKLQPTPADIIAMTRLVMDRVTVAQAAMRLDGE